MSEVLEWDVRVPLVSNVIVLVDILIALILVSGALVGAVLYMTEFQNVYGVLRMFLITDGILFVLIFSTMGLVFTNRFQLLYRLDEVGVLFWVGEFESSFNRIAWKISSLVQRYGVFGCRIFSMVSEELFVSWDGISHAMFDDRRRMASLMSDVRPVMRVYCTLENVDVVFDTIKKRLLEQDQ